MKANGDQKDQSQSTAYDDPLEVTGQSLPYLLPLVRSDPGVRRQFAVLTDDRLIIGYGLRLGNIEVRAAFSKRGPRGMSVLESSCATMTEFFFSKG